MGRLVLATADQHTAAEMHDPQRFRPVRGPLARTLTCFSMTFTYGSMALGASKLGMLDVSDLCTIDQ